MVKIPPILSLRLSIASGVMTSAIFVTASFCAAMFLYTPFLVLLDILPLLVEILLLLGNFGVVFVAVGR
jgi:hypothetical protein